MKKNLVFITMLTVLLALCFIGCELDEGDDGIAKTLVITGITGYTATDKIMVGIADVSKGKKAELVAYSEVYITSSSIDIPLLSYKKGNGEAYTGTGDYFILLFINYDTSTEKDYVYSNGTTTAVKYTIEKGKPSFSIPFNKFTEAK